MIEYLVRHHRFLTMVTIVEDPVYLTEPFIRTSDWVEAEGNETIPIYASRAWKSSTKGVGRLPPARAESVAERIRGKDRHPLRGFARRCGNDVSRISEKAGEDAGAPKAAETNRRRRGTMSASSSRPAGAVSMLRSMAACTCACALAMAVCAGGAAAERPRPAQSSAAQDGQAKPDSQVHIFHAQGNVYMLVEPTSNITLQIGEKYIIVVDTGVPELSDQVMRRSVRSPACRSCSS